MDSYKSFFNPTNMLVVAALIALILFRHSLFPEATESTEVKQLIGKVDEVIDDMQQDESNTAEVETESEPEPKQISQIPQSPQVTEQPTSEMVAPDQPHPTTEPELQAGDTDNSEALGVWQTARRAAWDGNSDAAIENYRALIKMQPDNYDAYGEMGNVLLQNGDKDGAVEAYSQAALLLGKSGYPQAAWHVMNIVANLDQSRANQLHQSLYGKPLPAVQ